MGTQKVFEDNKLRKLFFAIHYIFIYWALGLLLIPIYYYCIKIENSKILEEKNKENKCKYYSEQTFTFKKRIEKFNVSKEYIEDAAYKKFIIHLKKNNFPKPLLIL